MEAVREAAPRVGQPESSQVTKRRVGGPRGGGHRGYARRTVNGTESRAVTCRTGRDPCRLCWRWFRLAENGDAEDHMDLGKGCNWRKYEMAGRWERRPGWDSGTCI